MSVLRAPYTEAMEDAKSHLDSSGKHLELAGTDGKMIKASEFRDRNFRRRRGVGLVQRSLVNTVDNFASLANSLHVTECGFQVVSFLQCTRPPSDHLHCRHHAIP